MRLILDFCLVGSDADVGVSSDARRVKKVVEMHLTAEEMSERAGNAKKKLSAIASCLRATAVKKLLKCI